MTDDVDTNIKSVPKKNVKVNATNLHHEFSHIDPLTICTDLKQVSRLILHQSFAILKVDRKTHESLSHAWTAASEFFSTAVSVQQRCIIENDKSMPPVGHSEDITVRYYDGDDDDETSTKQISHQIEESSFLSKYRRISHGNLLGFNRPSPAKVLFRAFCSNWGKINGQPWPKPRSRFSLQHHSEDLATRLHKLLLDCLHQILRDCKIVHKDLGDDLDDGKDVVCKRRKVEVSPSSRHHSHRSHRKSSTTPSTLRIPRNLKDAGLCPLDYFLYHALNTRTKIQCKSANDNEDDNHKHSHLQHTAVVNCSEHIDRGILICISLTDVPGLEVMLPPITTIDDGLVRPGVFVCPEEKAIGRVVAKNSNTVGCTDLVCILSGDQLKSIAGMHSKDDSWNCAGRRLDACVHRVRSKLDNPRLSITYELRGEAAISGNS